MGTRLWVDDLAGLLGLIDLGVIELHTWNSKVDDLEHPDTMVFDLDPGTGVGFAFVTEIAFELREILAGEGLESWPKLTGGKGVHVMVPIPPGQLTHDQAHRISRALADKVVHKNPTRLTTAAALSARDGRLFIDYLRNGRGTTAVASYSPRARRGFPIAAPTTWRELEIGTRPDKYTLSQPCSERPVNQTQASLRRAPRHAQPVKSPAYLRLQTRKREAYRRRKDAAE